MDTKKHLALTVQAAALAFALAEDITATNPGARDRKEEALNALAQTITTLRRLTVD